MKIEYKISDRAKIEAECRDVKQVFAFLSHADDVLGVKKCGNCMATDLSFLHRQPQGFDYYSIRCNACGHELKFGQVKDTGRLFHKGWKPPYKDGDTQDEKTDARKQSRDEEPETVGAAAPGDGFDF